MALLVGIGGWALASSRGEFADPEIVEPGAPRIRENRRGHTTTALIDGRVLVTGGYGPLASTELYDPIAGEWSDGAPMTAARHGHTATLLADGRVLIAGGSACLTACSNLDSQAMTETYDPRNGRWTPTASMRATRSDHAAALLQDGRVLVAGGLGIDRTDGARGRFDVLHSAEIYDPPSDTWTTIAPMRLERDGAQAFTTESGRVAVSGGSPSQGDWIGAWDAAVAAEANTATIIEIFDPATESWTISQASPAELAFEHGRTWDLLLGRDQLLRLKGRSLESATEYGVEEDAWTVLSVRGATQTGNGFVDVSGTPPALLTDGRVFVSGGNGPRGSNQCSVFDPAAGAWTRCRAMNLPRGDHTAVLMASGKVLVFGGSWRGRDYLPPARHVMTSEVYDPATDSWAVR